MSHLSTLDNQEGVHNNVYRRFEVEVTYILLIFTIILRSLYMEHVLLLTIDVYLLFIRCVSVTRLEM